MHFHRREAERCVRPRSSPAGSAYVPSSDSPGGSPEPSNYHKIFGVSDAALNVAPTLDEKINIIVNAVGVMQKLGISNPKVAILAPVENISENC